MIYSMYMIGHFLFALKSAFLEIFQKSHGGLFIAARQHIHFWLIFGFLQWNRLAAPPWPPGDASLWLNLCFSLSFYMSLLVGKQGLGLRRRSSVGLHWL